MREIGDSRSASAARVWKKIFLFYGLTLAFSAGFEALELRAPHNIVLVTGEMWCPALAAMITQRAFGERLADLCWGWGATGYKIWAYVIPLLYALPVYLFAWTTGLGGFYDHAFAEQSVAACGLAGTPGVVGLAGFILITATAGFIPKFSRALGEEIGWRGFLVPELAKVTSFRGIGLISGLMWAGWHVPSILLGDYNAGTQPWFALTCFTVMAVSSSFIFAWLVLRSRSLWPAAILHGSHNLFIQLILNPLTTNTGRTPYLIDEFGAGLAITCVIGALIVWRKRDELPLAPAG